MGNKLLYFLGWAFLIIGFTYYNIISTILSMIIFVIWFYLEDKKEG